MHNKQKDFFTSLFNEDYDTLEWLDTYSGGCVGGGSKNNNDVYDEDDGDDDDGRQNRAKVIRVSKSFSILAIN